MRWRGRDLATVEPRIKGLRNARLPLLRVLLRGLGSGAPDHRRHRQYERAADAYRDDADRAPRSRPQSFVVGRRAGVEDAHRGWFRRGKPATGWRSCPATGSRGCPANGRRIGATAISVRLSTSAQGFSTQLARSPLRRISVLPHEADADDVAPGFRLDRERRQRFALIPLFVDIRDAPRAVVSEIGGAAVGPGFVWMKFGAAAAVARVPNAR